jgi:16S rRNA (cytosine967-C5)-methyltransferase
VVRRHPDGKWLKRAEDMQHLAREQRRLLEALWPLLKSGGTMLYVTCSLFRAENTNQITAFLDRHDDANIEPVFVEGSKQEAPTPTVLLPSAEMDGFFYARLHKT